MNATEDWETTCLIYDSLPTSTVLDNKGSLLRGSIELTVTLDHVLFCRKLAKNEQCRFWKEDQDLVFRLVFWCCPSNNDEYERVQVSLATPYPHSFPSAQQEEWLAWIQSSAQTMLQQESLSYSICTFVEQHGVLDFFTTLFVGDDDHTGPSFCLIQFQDGGPTFYEQPTLLVSGLQRQTAQPSPTKSSITSVLFPMHRSSPSGTLERLQNTQQLSRRERQEILPLVQRWKQWLPVECPICFETISPKHSATLASCGHAFCESCLTTYLRFKAKDELHHTNQDNPFTCPIDNCRRPVQTLSSIEPYLSKSLCIKLHEWQKDIQHPPCWSLVQCLKNDKCRGGVVRKENPDGFVVFCDACQGRWCELCLKRAPLGQPHVECPNEVAVRFCERYLAAGPKAQARCEEKWPWIKVYAKSRVNDLSILDWVQSNGQTCPGCKTAIERTEGCFHIRCHCGVHFCYECGAEIFAPFYGTHHCWEEDGFQYGE